MNEDALEAFEGVVSVLRPLRLLRCPDTKEHRKDYLGVGWQGGIIVYRFEVQVYFKSFTITYYLG